MIHHRQGAGGIGCGREARAREGIAPGWRCVPEILQRRVVVDISSHYKVFTRYRRGLRYADLHVIPRPCVPHTIPGYLREYAYLVDEVCGALANEGLAVRTEEATRVKETDLIKANIVVVAEAGGKIVLRLILSRVREPGGSLQHYRQGRQLALVVAHGVAVQLESAAEGS